MPPLHPDRMRRPFPPRNGIDSVRGVRHELVQLAGGVRLAFDKDHADAVRQGHDYLTNSARNDL